MRDLIGDLRHGARSLAGRPGFSLLAILSLALGIGVNSTIFTLVNAFLLRPPAGVHDADRLVWLFQTGAAGERGRMTLSYPDFVDARGQRDVLAGAAAYTGTSFQVGQVGGDAGAELVSGQLVSSDYFGVLRVAPALGQALPPGEDPPPAVVLGHGLWQRRFHGDPSIVGRTVLVDRKPFTVAGVAPPGFVGPELAPAAEVWIPLAADPDGTTKLGQRNVHRLSVVARLNDGVELRAAAAALDALAGHLAQAYPDTNKDIGFQLTPLAGGLNPGDRGDAVPLALLLSVVVGLILLIAGVNVGGLLLARGSARRRELAIRRALGATRARLVRQLLVESVLLSLAGGAAALLLAVWAGDLLASALRGFAFAPIALDTAPDVRVLGYTFAVALGSGLLFGLAPALRATRVDPGRTLAAETTGATASARRSRLRSAFVVTQVALSLLLLVGAGLFVRSLAHARDIDPGFDPEHALTMRLELDTLQLGEPEGRDLYRRVVERVAAVPGVRVASLAQILPLGRSAMIWRVGVERKPTREAPGADVLTNAVAPGYFEALRIPLTRGRDFRPADDDAAPAVIIVNETFARALLGGDPLGQRVWAGGKLAEVVGVARDSKSRSLGEPAAPFMYVPLAQSYHPSAHLIAGVAGPGVAEAVRQAVASVESGLATTRPILLARTVDASLFPARMGAVLLGALGLLALVLAVIGVYGVLAYAVRLRTRELGIRLALGASRGAVLRLVIGDGLTLVAIGLAVGLALAVAATRFLASFLYAVSPTDPLTFGGVIVLFAVVALLASWLPARRASRVDPLIVLRADE